MLLATEPSSGVGALMIWITAGTGFLVVKASQHKYARQMFWGGTLVGVAMLLLAYRPQLEHWYHQHRAARLAPAVTAAKAGSNTNALRFYFVPEKDLLLAGFTVVSNRLVAPTNFPAVR